MTKLVLILSMLATAYAASELSTVAQWQYKLSIEQELLEPLQQLAGR